MMSRYDIDNSGAIDREEMVNVMKAIYSMVDGNVSEAIRGSTMEKVIVGPICHSSIEFLIVAGSVACREALHGVRH